MSTHCNCNVTAFGAPYARGLYEKAETLWSCTSTVFCCLVSCSTNSSMTISSNAKPCANAGGVNNKANSNLSFSTLKAVKQKKINVTNRLMEIKDLIYFPLGTTLNLVVDGVNIQLFTYVKKPEVQLLLEKSKNWKISYLEKRNLFDNLVSSSIGLNNLNLFWNVKNKLLINGLGNIDSIAVNNYIQQYLNNLIYRILIYAEISSELDQYDYTQLFNLTFNYITLNLNLLKPKLYGFIPAIIRKFYGKGKVTPVPINST